MVTDEHRKTSFGTIMIVILRELRMERGLHQAHIAQWLDKTPSAWTKIEAGKSPLSLEMFLRACALFQVSPSAVMATAERYSYAMGNSSNPSSITVLLCEIEPHEDALMTAAQEYWTSPGFRMMQINRQPLQSILNGPIYTPEGIVILAPVFLFAIDPTFRAQQKQQPLPSPPLITY